MDANVDHICPALALHWHEASEESLLLVVVVVVSGGVASFKFGVPVWRLARLWPVLYCSVYPSSSSNCWDSESEDP
jgi:hypothetical protein